jgi:DNA polymerase III subunit epsilon
MKVKTESRIGKIDFLKKPFNNIVIFDLETTGLSPQINEIIQIGAVRIRKGEILENDSFFTYVKPKYPISDFITEYTGITNKDVVNAPPIKKVLPVFSKYCGNSLLIAHSGANFDIPFISATCYRNRIPTRSVNFIDSVHISWNVWGRKGVPHRLDSLQRRLKVSSKGLRMHDARGDVYVTANCVCKMVNILNSECSDISIKLYNSIFPKMAS